MEVLMGKSSINDQRVIVCNSWILANIWSLFWLFSVSRTHGNGKFQNIIYPLVNVNKKLWKTTLFNGKKLTISMAILNSKLLTFTRPGSPKDTLTFLLTHLSEAWRIGVFEKILTGNPHRIGVFDKKKTSFPLEFRFNPLNLQYWLASPLWTPYNPQIIPKKSADIP